MKIKIALLSLAAVLAFSISCSKSESMQSYPFLVSSSHPAQPHRYRISASDLPAPYATPSANNGPHVDRYDGGVLHVPPGFEISEWAAKLNNPRSMIVAPNGDVLVVESDPGRIVLLRDTHGAGKPDVKSTVVEGLNLPFGIALYPPGPHPSYLYVGNTNSVVRYPYKPGDLKVTGPAQAIVPELPSNGYHNHWTRRVIFSPDGKKMYVSVGSQSNVGEEEERRAAILEFNPDGSGYRVYASGLRNAVGLNFNPISHKLWAAVNERDGLGDDDPPDYATSVQPGGFYGWPYYYIGQHHDPRMPQKPELKSKTIIPDVLLEAHSAALSVLFYAGHSFPNAYRNDGFVGLHGSWNRSERSGYKVVRLPMKPDGTADGSYEDFVWGWALPNGHVWGRPVDVVMDRAGAVLITDDGGEKIWRVRYVDERHPPKAAK